MHTDYKTPTGGITSENRERLARLHRRAPGPFTVTEASHALDEDPVRTRKLLAPTKRSVSFSAEPGAADRTTGAAP